jgi:hypothetical protein
MHRWTRPLMIWAFLSEITENVILGLDTLGASDASVDVEYHALGMGGEKT